MLWDVTIILVIPAFIFALICQFRVSSAFKRYSKTANRNGWTGAQAAQALLSRNGLDDVRIERIDGNLSDNYDPRDRTLRLSADVYDSKSLAAVGVAAHEAGHAIQHGTGYMPLNVRSSMLPIVKIGSGMAMPVFLLGMIFTGLSSASGDFGYIIMQIGILLFTFVVAFQLVTLPVEFNASKRALRALADEGILESDEIIPAKSVLSAAAMTYVAAAAVSVTQLLRLLLLSGRRR